MVLSRRQLVAPMFSSTTVNLKKRGYDGLLEGTRISFDVRQALRD
jgi:hypothetical protein